MEKNVYLIVFDSGISKYILFDNLLVPFIVFNNSIAKDIFFDSLPIAIIAVSYTHLTLPTILRV